MIYTREVASEVKTSIRVWRIKKKKKKIYDIWIDRILI